MQTLSFPEADTPAELRAQVVALEDRAWPSRDDPAGRSPDVLSHDRALRPLTMLRVDDGGAVLAALCVLFKKISHAGRSYRAAGLSTVVTRGDVRGAGHGVALVSAAREEMAAQEVDVGLFTCDRRLQRFYERAGWSVLRGTVLVGGTPAVPLPSDQPGFDKVAMGAFFSAVAQEHRASFHHARVELYPGEVDALW